MQIHMNMSFPLKRHVTSLLLNIKHLGHLGSLRHVTFSPPLVCSLSPTSFDVISLPLWQQFPRRVWSLRHSTKHLYKCDACRGQDSLSGAGSEEIQNKWQTVFPVGKSVAPSGMFQLYRKNSVVPKITNRWNRVHRRENTCHLSSLD